MKGTNGWQEVGRKFAHSLPRREIPLTPPPQRATPEDHDVIAKRIHAPTVSWDRVIREVPANHLRQPSALPRDWFVHPPPQLLLDFPESRSHPISGVLPVSMRNVA